MAENSARTGWRFDRRYQELPNHKLIRIIDWTPWSTSSASATVDRTRTDDGAVMTSEEFERLKIPLRSGLQQRSCRCERRRCENQPGRRKAIAIWIVLSVCSNQIVDAPRSQADGKNRSAPGRIREASRELCQKQEDRGTHRQKLDALATFPAKNNGRS